MIAGVSKSKAFRASQQTGNSGQSWWHSLESEFHRAAVWKFRQNFIPGAEQLVLWGTLHFTLESFNYWMGLTYFMQNNLFYSKSTDLNVNYIFKKKKKTFTVTYRPVFDQRTGHHGNGAMLTHNINHHSWNWNSSLTQKSLPLTTIFCCSKGTECVPWSSISISSDY